MSKLEEALNKARAIGAMKNLVPTDSEHAPMDLEARAETSRQIANMDEPRHLTGAEMDERRIIYPEMSNRKAANRFRELRTKLLRSGGGDNFTILVTSVSIQGGASFVSLNLAAAFSFDESKTALLIDCNLREPALQGLVGIEPEFGLTDYLEDSSIEVDRIIHPTGIHRLRLIPVGRRREVASEYFTSLRMKMFLDSVRRRYPDRYVIIDAPPIGESADAKILADLCDFVIIVVPYGKVTESQIMSAAKAVNKQKLVGVVLNNEPDGP